MGRTLNIYEAAARDPKIMADLLRRKLNKEEAARVFKWLHGYLFHAGAVATEESPQEGQ
jgi:hypothetical protein